MGGTRTTVVRLPASLSSDPSLTTTGTCGSSGIRALHADDANGGSSRFAGAGNISSARNLDVDKVGAADSLLAVVVMVMVIIVVERIKIKRSRSEEVGGGQLKWAVDKSKGNVRAMSPQLEGNRNPYSNDKSKKIAGATG